MIPSKVLAASLLVAALAGTTLATAGSAQAHDGRNAAFAAGAAVGLLGGAVLAAPAYSAPAPAYYEPTYYAPSCYWTKQRWYDAWGVKHVRRVRVCD